MAERIYRYRDFDILIDVKPLEGAGGNPIHRFLAGYLCHVHLSGKAGQPDLPSLALPDKGARLFVDEQEAVIVACCAGEAAIDATLAKTVDDYDALHPGKCLPISADHRPYHNSRVLGTDSERRLSTTAYGYSVQHGGYANFDVVMCAGSAGPGRPRSIGRLGAAACTIQSQHEQANLG